MNAVPFILTSLSAALAGAINAIAGGGTFLTFPALVSLAGLTEKSANITSTVGLWFGSASSIAAAKNDIAKLPRNMVKLYSAISLLGGTAGALLLVFTRNETFRYAIPWLLAFATLLFAFSKPIARWAGRKHGDRSFKWTLFVGFIQFFVAVYGGYFGAGIGVLMLASLAFAGLDSIHQMNALKALLATLINGAAALVFVLYSLFTATSSEKVHWPLAIAMALLALLGGYYGMKLARKINPQSLRHIILGIALSLTIIYFKKAYFV